MHRRLVALTLGVVAVTGCAGMPTQGGVHVGRALPAAGADIDIRAVPPGPRPHMKPADVVAGYLQALVNDDENYAIAREFLTPDAASRWNSASGITTYDDSSLAFPSTTTVGATRVVRVSAQGIGRIDARGDYTPAPASLHPSFTLALRLGEWRIDNLPSGVLLSAVDAQRVLKPFLIYYLSRSRPRTLVPEQIVVRSDPPALATALTKALLSGPGAWLAPAVRSAIPTGTVLLGNVPVDPSGVADVNLGPAVRLANADDLKALSAQIVWTLRQVPDISAVRIDSDGSVLPVVGIPPRQPVTSWQVFDPAAAPSISALLYSVGQRVQVVGTLAANVRAAAGVSSSATLSPDGTALAVVRNERVGQALLVGPVDGPLRRALSATSLTPPTFSPTGDVLTIARTAAGQRLMVIPRGGHSAVVVDADPLLLRRPVRQFRMSRDGARVAAVVGAGGDRLLIGRVTGAGSGRTVSGFRNIAVGIRDIRGLSWVDAADVAVTAVVSGRRQLVITDVDGYNVRTPPLDAVRGDPVDVTAAPGQPLFVVTSGGLLYGDIDGWQRVGATGASAPSYPD